MDKEDPKDEAEDTLVSLVTWVSNLEKTQNDILTLLCLMSNWLNAIPKSLIETACKCVSFVLDETVEPCTPLVIAHVESDVELPHMANILKDLKPSTFGDKEKCAAQRMDAHKDW